PSTKSWAWLATRSASGCQTSADPASGGPATGALHIKQPPSFERAPEGHLVRVLQVPSDRKPTRRPGHPQPQRLDAPGQVGRGRLSLQVRVRRQDQLRDAAVGQPGHEFPGPQVLRADPVNGADRTTQDMVSAAKFADLLDGRNVLGLLDDADHRRVPARVLADPALLFHGHVAAHPAEPDLLGDLDQHRGEPAHVGRVGAQQVKRDALGALGPDPRQPAELVDEVLDHSVVHVRPLRSRSRRATPGQSRTVPSGSSPPWAASPPAMAPPRGAAPPAGAAPPPKNPESPGTSPGPPPPSAASGPIFSCWSSPAARYASRTAASTRSATVCAASAGSVTSTAAALITRSTSSPWPLTVAVPRPPPAVPSPPAAAPSRWGVMCRC